MCSNDLPEFEDSAAVRRLLDPSAHADRMWTLSEMAPLLRHQLEATIWEDLVYLGAAQVLEGQNACAGSVPPIRSYRELFSSSNPPPEVLRLVKQFAQAMLHTPESTLPHGVAMYLYDASILAARWRLGMRISDLPDEQLSRGVRWLCSQPWLDEESRQWFTTAVKNLESTDRGAPSRS